MSVDYTIVNPAKRQYFDIEAFGEFDKYPLRAWGNEDGRCLHALALSLLVSHPSFVGDGLFGSWSGDAIYFPSDHNEADNSGFSFGIYTASPDDPQRSLYLFSAKNYKNISKDLIVAICNWDNNNLKTLISRATSEHPYFLCKLLLDIIENDSSIRSSFLHSYTDEAPQIIDDMRKYVSAIDSVVEKY